MDPLMPSDPLAVPAGTTEPRSRHHGHDLGFRFAPNPSRAGRSRNLDPVRDLDEAHSLLVRQEPDRLNCWALIVALASSATGMTLLLTALHW
jgi:hypothetical protein